MNDTDDAFARTATPDGVASTMLPGAPQAEAGAPQAEAGAPMGNALAQMLASPELVHARASARAKLFGTGDAPPMRVDRFIVVRRLGSGGMGVVYAAYDPQLDRKVAVKVLRPDADVERNAQLRARLLREAQAMAKVTHPNVITVHEVGTFEGQVFIAMEFLDGTTLRRWLESGQRRWSEIRDTFVAVGRGLAAAHAAGLVHRDLKPDNIMVAGDRVVVLDFGLATQRNAVIETMPEAPTARALAPEAMTETGAMLGTPAYMAPEQLRGAHVDARADQFSFCVALFEAIYGRRPFSGGTLAALVDAVCSGRIEAPDHRGDLPAGAYRAIVRGLSTDPEARFPSMDALLVELARRRWSPRRRLAVAAASVLVAGAIATTAQQIADDPACDAAAALLSRGWSSAVRQRGSEAFAATGKPYAAEAWGTVEHTLDDHAARWRGIHDAVCEGTAVAETERLGRLVCLEWRAQELGALAELFGGADGDVVDRAIEATDELTAPEACSSERALGTAARLPTDPAVRRALFDARGRLAAAKGLGDAGKFDEALGIVEDLRDDPITRTHPPIVVEIELRRGRLRRGAGDFAGAEQALAAAVYAGIGEDDDAAALRGATELVWLLGSDRNAFEAALPWLRIGEAIAKRIADPAATGGLLVATGAMFASAGRNTEARAAFERAIAEEVTGDTPAPESIEARLRMASFSATNGDPAAGLATAESALQLAVASVGADHPTTARVHLAIGELALSMGRYDDARTHGQRALEIEQSVRGAEHPATASPSLVLARTAWATGDPETAKAALDRIDTVARVGRVDDATLVGALSLRGLWLAHVSRTGEAEEALDRALAIARRHGEDHPLQSWPLEARAEILLGTAKPEQALRTLELARASLGAGVGPTDPRRQQLAVATARALLAQGENARALDVLDRAAAVLESCCRGHALLGEIEPLRAAARLGRATPDRG